MSVFVACANPNMCRHVKNCRKGTLPKDSPSSAPAPLIKARKIVNWKGCSSMGSSFPGRYFRKMTSSSSIRGYIVSQCSSEGRSRASLASCWKAFPLLGSQSWHDRQDAHASPLDSDYLPALMGEYIWDRWHVNRIILRFSAPPLWFIVESPSQRSQFTRFMDPGQISILIRKRDPSLNSVSL